LTFNKVLRSSLQSCGLIISIRTIVSGVRVRVVSAGVYAWLCRANESTT